MITSVVEKVLISESEIKEICIELGKQISNDYNDKNLLVLGILKGSLPFMADIIRNIEIDCVIDFMCLSSYCGAKSSGTVTIKKDMDKNPKGYDILIVEDIVDTGLTLGFLKEELLNRGASSVKICSFLDKPENRNFDMKIDYCGRAIPNEFVVGYGLDYNEKYRNLPYVGILAKEVYADK